VKVFMFGELEDGALYIIMEFLEGKNLNQTVRAEGPFPMERALPILIAVCGALDEAHKAGIIHRDLKPENIFLVQSSALHDYPKVLDFGLAKVGERQLRPGSIMLTQEGMVFGTPEFMSPEQAQGKTLTPGGDVYSLAVILYEVLTGKLPFDAKSAMDFIQLHVTGKPIPLNSRVLGKTFPPLLEQVIDRALAKKPEDRFTSAADFATALDCVLRGATQLPKHLIRAPSVPPAPTTPPPGLASAPRIAPGASAARPREAQKPGGPLAAAPPPPAALPRPAKRAAPAKTSVPLLAAIALGFLLLGVGLAMILMKVLSK
jgi:serine/threonine-protein kinase